LQVHIHVYEFHSLASVAKVGIKQFQLEEFALRLQLQLAEGANISTIGTYKHNSAWPC